MEAYVNGVSTRAVDDLVVALRVESGISKSEVSRICAGLDEQVEAFRSRPLHHTGLTNVLLDVTYLQTSATPGRSPRLLSWSPPGSPTPAAGKSVASTSAIARMRCFGVASSAASKNAACHGVRLVFGI